MIYLMPFQLLMTELSIMNMAGLLLYFTKRKMLQQVLY